ncbi:MAG TPA: type II toxin-antitoxin system HicB family antitoxin [Leptolyngbya sp.]|jgi:predicted RNase H-like HicB family nuclease|nr:type II toxin-antitoxin system HicB family antitoxin [Leptolyngbya sp.]
MHQRIKDKPDSLEDYLQLNYPITFYPEPDGGYTVMIRELPGCISQGDTLEEAMQNIQEAKEAWLETAIAYQDEIPLPSKL